MEIQGGIKMNSIQLIGRLTEQVELKQTQSGIPVCAFALAVKRPHSKDVTDFLNCVAWRHTAEFISKYFGKGQMIAITGCLTSRKYEDKDGNKRTAYEVVVDNAEFCGSKNPQNENEGTSYDQEEPQFEEISLDDELPF